MTVPVTREQIPDSAFEQGIEGILVWAFYTLEHKNNGETFNEAEGIRVDRVQQSVFRSYDKEVMVSMRANIRLHSDYNTGNYGAIWQSVKPYYTGTIPPEYLQAGS